MPHATREIITTYNLEELDAYNTAPDADIAWADRATHVSIGAGIVKVAHRLPQSMAFQPFKYGGNRTYFSVDVAATEIHVQPWELSFAWPMIWDQIGNGYKLMSESSDGTLVEFTGAGGLAAEVINAGRAYKAQLVASLFFTSFYAAGVATTPTQFSVAQPGNPLGIALFSDGTGADGSGGALHYAHPINHTSGRFKNVYTTFGPFSQKFGKSLQLMGQKPHATLPNVTNGARVTDVIGPTWMRERFWEMAVQSLSLQTATVAGTPVGAAPTNPYAIEVLKKFAPDTFIGAAGFTPQTFWICPALDSHPYFTVNSGANMTSGPDGGPADMWVNIAGGPNRGAWARLAASSRDFTPRANYYGEGDPRAMTERRVRLETDLDAGVAPGNYDGADMFFGV